MSVALAAQLREALKVAHHGREHRLRELLSEGSR